MEDFHNIIILFLIHNETFFFLYIKYYFISKFYFDNLLKTIIEYSYQYIYNVMFPPFLMYYFYNNMISIVIRTKHKLYKNIRNK
ncbi:hypothetical protein PFAG_02024 [Plasmodium falciparum Santa Lucia]|uniref:Uncharacterized protein n=1 Tax=Plasmodium falciparum Santa Lucia TaxID=478859 RepID=W7FRK1_PLAFA|nr:hypothetical protein PFAG_02024 [Plasmodium falciparum Santa Lucia]